MFGESETRMIGHVYNGTAGVVLYIKDAADLYPWIVDSNVMFWYLQTQVRDKNIMLLHSENP